MTPDDPLSDNDAESKGSLKPEFEVWNHLWSGVDKAYDDLEQTVGRDGARFFDSFGEIVYKALTRLFVNPADPTLATKLAKEFPGLAHTKRATLFHDLLRAYRAGSAPVLKHSVDLQLGSEAIRRAEGALDRLHLLTESLANAPLPPSVREYLAEVVHTFLFGFDAASIALARSALEQMAREVLVQKGVYTRARLKRDRPTAFNLLNELKRGRLIDETLQRAETLVTRANTISHRHMYEGRIMRQQALTSITELAQVLTELAAHLRTDSDGV